MTIRHLVVYTYTTNNIILYTYILLKLCNTTNYMYTLYYMNTQNTQNTHSVQMNIL
jgi:hypothetical protein